MFKNVKIEPRQRVLSEAEIRAFWIASEKLGYPYGPFYRLLLLTGVRVSELSKAQWAEFHPELRRRLREATKAGTAVDWSAVDNGIKTWTVPRERFKSDSEHIVPLSDDACSMLATLPHFAGCDFLFTVGNKRAINNLPAAKLRLDAFMRAALAQAAAINGDEPDQTKLLPPWVNHDLRRALRTNLSALDIADHIAEMTLGHGRRGLQRIYDQHRYLPQQRDAFEKWAAKLRTIAGSTPTPPADNIVALPARRKVRR